MQGGTELWNFDCLSVVESRDVESHRVFVLYQMLIIILLSGKSITEENVIEWVEEEQAIATDETSRFILNGINLLC